MKKTYTIKYTQSTPMGLTSTHDYTEEIVANNAFNACRKFRSQFKQYFSSDSAYTIFCFEIVKIGDTPVHVCYEGGKVIYRDEAGCIVK